VTQRRRGGIAEAQRKQRRDAEKKQRRRGGIAETQRGDAEAQRRYRGGAEEVSQRRRGVTQRRRGVMRRRRGGGEIFCAFCGFSVLSVFSLSPVSPCQSVERFLRNLTFPARRLIMRATIGSNLRGRVSGLCRNSRPAVKARERLFRRRLGEIPRPTVKSGWEKVERACGFSVPARVFVPSAPRKLGFRGLFLHCAPDMPRAACPCPAPRGFLFTWMIRETTDYTDYSAKSA